MVKHKELCIMRLSSIFGSRAKAQEIILLLDNIKPVVRQGFYAKELPSILEFCNNQGISIVRSRFMVNIEDLDKEFSNKGIISNNNNNNNNGMFFIYLSKERILASKAALLEERHDDESLGRILGYPECCIKYFLENFTENHTNLEQKSSNPYTNLSLRSKDCVILSHFPCHPECKESIILGKKYLETIAKHDSEYAKELLSKLSELR